MGAHASKPHKSRHHGSHPHGHHAKAHGDRDKPIAMVKQRSTMAAVLAAILVLFGLALVAALLWWLIAG
ncbi:MAG: hypothetical protein MUE97_03300 [Phycisphaerales bacterium]|jgi:hypothetical protein|nr:hypothetical protein [Phycisphaerales bacterium]